MSKNNIRYIEDLKRIIMQDPNLTNNQKITIETLDINSLITQLKLSNK